MAMRVPEYNRQVGPGELPGVRQNIHVDASNFLGGTEQVFLQQSAAAFKGMEQAAVQLQVERDRETDHANLINAAAQLQQYDTDSQTGSNGGLGWSAMEGVNALVQANGKGLEQNVLEDRQQRVEAIMDSLTSDRQKRLFAEHVTESEGSVYQRVATHVTKQQQVHAKKSLLTGIDAEAQAIQTNYNDPKVRDQGLSNIDAYSRQLASLSGTDEAFGNAQARKNKSDALKGAIERALMDNDHASAVNILHDHGQHMDTNDWLKATKTIRTADHQQQALSIGQSVISEIYPGMQEPSDIDRMLNITQTSESGGRRYGKDGELLESPKGALGEMQVMPETAKNPGFGIAPARDGSPEELARVGREYLPAMMRAFGGDPAKAWAAYNAGHVKVTNAIDKAEKEGGNWLTYLPKETQNYVTHNMNAFAAGEGKPPAATLQDAIRLSDQKARMLHGDNADPELINGARAEATFQFKMQEDAIKQRQAESVANAMRKLEENGGRYSALSPQDITNVPQKDRDNLRNYGQKIAFGDDITSLWLYNKLVNHPEELAKLSDDAFYALRTDLSEADFKHFSNERQKLKGATGGNDGSDLNSQAIKTELDNRLRMLGTDPAPSDTLQKDLANRVGGIRQFVNQYFLAAQMEAGNKKFTDREVAQHLDALFAKNYAFKGFWSDSSGTLLNMKVSDLPEQITAGLKAAFKRQGNTNPTDAQLLNAYWATQTTVKK